MLGTALHRKLLVALDPRTYLRREWCSCGRLVGGCFLGIASSNIVVTRWSTKVVANMVMVAVVVLGLLVRLARVFVRLLTLVVLTISPNVIVAAIVVHRWAMEVLLGRCGGTSTKLFSGRMAEGNAAVWIQLYKCGALWWWCRSVVLRQ